MEKKSMKLPINKKGICIKLFIFFAWGFPSFSSICIQLELHYSTSSSLILSPVNISDWEMVSGKIKIEEQLATLYAERFPHSYRRVLPMCVLEVLLMPLPRGSWNSKQWTCQYAASCQVYGSFLIFWYCQIHDPCQFCASCKCPILGNMLTMFAPLRRLHKILE